ncbi:deoxyribose-phosphate aldolase [uncultured Ruthenibacterium sp.]|uniref:deoxyribose-phosphate aldolase n=1 Tax=uncultured Ruthenibacterium sp. TaxID=1905347 RepID=UPI00349EA41D
MEKEELLARVDHTLLNPEATWDQVKQICDEAVRFHTASVCINPCYVRQAVEYLAGRVPVCTVIGFPLGATSTQAKLAEAQQALMDGCSEFDMVINIGRLKMGDVDFVRSEIAALKQLVGKHILKVIVETCLLTDVEKAIMCDVVCEAGADYIKTSTGFSKGGATFEDIALFAQKVRGRCKIKAAGGIRTREDMERFVQLGADRLGTSRGIRILCDGSRENVAKNLTI